MARHVGRSGSSPPFLATKEKRPVRLMVDMALGGTDCPRRSASVYTAMELFESEQEHASARGSVPDAQRRIRRCPRRKQV